MKKILLITALTISLHGFTQITVTSSNLPNVGDQLLQAWDTIPTVTVGSAGANQTWVYTGLETEDSTLLTFSDPQWTANGSYYPNSNLAMVIDVDRIFYLNKSASGLHLHGFVGNLGYGVMTLVANNPETIVEMPMNYGDAYLDTSLIDSTADGSILPFPGIDSVRLKRQIEHEYSIDAWGSLTTPIGTFSVLRQKTYTVTIDTVWTKPMFSPWGVFTTAVDTTYGYSFWSDDANARFPLVELTVDEFDNVISADWLKIPPVQNSVEEEEFSMDISIYPNPANEVIYLDYETDFDRFEIFDITGKSVMSKNNVRVQTLSIKSLKPGIYFLSVYKNAERRTIRFVKS